MPDYTNTTDDPVTVTLCDVTVDLSGGTGPPIIRAIPQPPITILPDATCQLDQIVDGNVLVLILTEATP